MRRKMKILLRNYLAMIRTRNFPSHVWTAPRKTNDIDFRFIYLFIVKLAANEISLQHFFVAERKDRWTDIDDDRVIHALRISITRIESRFSYVSVTEDRPIHHLLIKCTFSNRSKCRVTEESGMTYSVWIIITVSKF